jgi:hypothetical protein
MSKLSCPALHLLNRKMLFAFSGDTLLHLEDIMANFFLHIGQGRLNSQLPKMNFLGKFVIYDTRTVYQLSPCMWFLALWELPFFDKLFPIIGLHQLAMMYGYLSFPQIFYFYFGVP